MAAGFNIESIATAKMLHNGTVKPVGAMWLNGQQVWPKISYVITSASVVYTASSVYPGESLNYIAAKGDNYATIVGTVEKRRGTRVKETYTNVTLIPVNSSASSDFYVSNTDQIHAYDLQSTIKQMTSATFGAKYISEDGIESELYDITISQQGNQITSTVDTVTAIGVGIDITGANFGVTGGTGTLSATKVYSRTYTYTSTYEHTDYGQTADISDSATYTLTGTGGATISGRTMSVSSRVRNITAGAWVVTGTYTEGGTTYTDTLDVSQTADVKISETMSASNYSISIGVGTSSISASGGSATLNWGGTYTLTITQIWQSDPDTPYVITQQNIPISSEHISITESGNTSGRFHRSGASVTHDNMTTNKTTDSVTYTASVVIEGETLAHDSVSLSATNSEVSTREVTTGFGLGVSQTSFTVDGGTATLSATRVYSVYATLTTGYEILKSSGNTQNVTSSTTFSISGSSGGSISGTTLTIADRKKNANAGAWIVTGAWSSYTDTEEVSQAADTYTDTASDLNYTVSIDVASSTISAAGGSATLNWSAGHTHRIHRVWGSGETENIDTPVTDTATISGSASYFSRNGATVTHDNMGTRLATDSVRYTATNNGVSDYVELSATNTRSVYRAAYTTGFTITAPSKVSSDGATVAIGGVRAYVTTEYVYDSGSHQGGDAAQTGVNATSVTINSRTPSGSWCSASGGSIVVNANTEYTSDRSATFTASYDGYSDSGTITQWRNDITTTSYNCTALALGASSVAATVYGRANGVSVTFTATKTTSVTHDGVQRDPVTVVSPDAHYIINSNVAFELYNITRGTSATSQLTAYSGDAITIYPLAANASTTTDKDTYISALNSGQVQFTQEKAIAKEEIYIDGRIQSLGLAYDAYALATSAVHSDITVNVTIGTQSYDWTIRSGNTESEHLLLSSISLVVVNSVAPTSDEYANYHAGPSPS